MDFVVTFFRDTLDGPLYVGVVIVNSILIFICLKYLGGYYFNIGRNKKAKTQDELDQSLFAAQALLPAGATIESTGMVTMPVDAFAQHNTVQSSPVIIESAPVVVQPVVQPNVVVHPDGTPVQSNVVVQQHSISVQSAQAPVVAMQKAPVSNSTQNSKSVRTPIVSRTPSRAIASGSKNAKKMVANPINPFK